MTQNKYKGIIDVVASSSILGWACLLLQQVLELVLKVLHCAVKNCGVVACHVDGLVACCEAV